MLKKKIIVEILGGVCNNVVLEGFTLDELEEIEVVVHDYDNDEEEPQEVNKMMREEKYA